MRFLTILFLLAGLLLLVMNIRVTVLVFSSNVHTVQQKIFQLLFVWLVPFAGAIVTHYVHIGKPRKMVESWTESGIGMQDGGGH
jgi:hypothetical protein